MKILPARRIKLTFILTHHIRWVPFELTARLIDKEKFDVDYLILGKSDPIIKFLKDSHIPVTSYEFNDYKNTPEAINFAYEYLVQRQPDIVQTHWFAGSLVGLQAAYYAKVPVRIFHREHPPLQYYNRHSLSKHQLIWKCATHFIAVTNTSRLGMIEDGIPEDKITVIPTGFDLEEFMHVASIRIQRLKAKYLSTETLRRKGPVIGVAARYVHWKGVEYIINAFKRVLEEYPDALLILSGSHIDRQVLFDQLAAANSDAIVAPQYQDALSIFSCTDQLPKDSHIEIPFEDDLFALFKLFDIFVHVPIDAIQETFGQVYVEAMLAKVPSVITRSGSALDHAIHRENAWVVDYKNSDQIAEGILSLLSDQDLRVKIIDNAYRLASLRYDMITQIRTMEDYYINLLNSPACQTDQLAGEV